MPAEIDIINSALRLVGQKSIASLDDGSDQADIVRLYFNSAKESFLEEFDWHFALRRKVKIPRFADSDNHVYALPHDFKRLVTLHPWHEDYRIALYNDELGLWSEQKDLKIDYITKDISLENLTASALEVWIMRLAMYIDHARNAGANLQRLTQSYGDLIKKAISLEPTTHKRAKLDMGVMNRERICEGTEHGFAHELRDRHR